MVITPYEMLLGDQIKENKMSGSCNTHRMDEIFI